MPDVHKACQLLINKKLIELKPDFLANNVNFVESYFKLIDEVEFALKLTYFDINNIQLYYDTLTNVDTKNSTNITSVALTLLQSPPYSTYVSNIDPNLAKNPSSKKIKNG
ncbi:unnamed protein product [Didymodactylos carnosus]|uniref:Uncharacterized protein n=1 Tax=Didymodactylos carnosus TaxID=1234261 RepID=A0A8S2HM79_9BILA|nr:unnamed protein product [Didymodactylos carnosus]CAF3666004.1 unnamed protein product [Didymodactylos carnosus]